MPHQSLVKITTIFYIRGKTRVYFIYRQKIGIGPNTLAKLSKNEYVSMDVLVRICIELNCSFDDVVEIVRDDRKLQNK